MVGAFPAPLHEGKHVSTFWQDRVQFHYHETLAYRQALVVDHQTLWHIFLNSSPF
jgi:hypothetical protein